MISTSIAKLRLRTQFLILLGILLCGFLFFGHHAWRTIQNIRIGGTMYTNIIRAKNLVADILPPPSYIIESYLITLRLNNTSNPSEQKKLQSHLKELKNAYDVNQQAWLNSPLEENIKIQFLKAAHEPAQEFYRLVFNEYLPALKQNNVVKKEAILKKIEFCYEQHRKAIDQVVILANQKNNLEEASAQDVIEHANRVMFLSLMMTIVLALTLFVLITKPLISCLSALRAKFQAMAQGDLSQDFFSMRKDEIGEIFASASFMQDQLHKATRTLQHENKKRRRMEALLRKAPQELQTQVQKRTSELKNANNRLELEVLERKRIEQELILSREQLRARSAHLEAIREEERKHIAMEIHDELGQLLTATKMDLSLLRYNLSDQEQSLKKIHSIIELVEKTIIVVRNISSRLRPGALNLGIVAALEWLADNFNQHNTIYCETDIHCDDITIEDIPATIIFRIAQESLTNVMRHASASRVVIKLTRNENTLELHIKDNGKGFDINTINKSLSQGLFGIQERARLINASLCIDSKIDQGTHIIMHIPFKT